MTTAVSLAQSVAPGVSLGFKNRIINGAMMIDQRNAGASVNVTNGNPYTLDRWQGLASQASAKFSVQQSTNAPSGFTNSLKVTSLSAYSVPSSEQYIVRQQIEGYNTADLGFGTASPKIVTISFWVYSSLTGSFGASICNNDGSRSYSFSYTINAANTWEQKSVTITGDTTGTWQTGNLTGIILSISLGSTYNTTENTWSAGYGVAPAGKVSVVGTNGATFYITGVQLEVGTAATSFEFRDYGRELIMCQRYYEKSYSIDTAPATNTTTNNYQLGGTCNAYGNAMALIEFCVQKRATPTMTAIRPDGYYGYWNLTNSGGTSSAGVSIDNFGTNRGRFYFAAGSAFQAVDIWGHWTASAEL